VNAQDKDNRMRLHGTAKNWHLDIIKILLEKGTDIKARNKKDQTRLELAQAEEIRFILQKARIDAKETKNESRRYREAERSRKKQKEA
jgi:hypothetical protein